MQSLLYFPMKLHVSHTPQSFTNAQKFSELFNNIQYG